jgi:hypothetical protein
VNIPAVIPGPSGETTFTTLHKSCSNSLDIANELHESS